MGTSGTLNDGIEKSASSGAGELDSKGINRDGELGGDSNTSELAGDSDTGDSIKGSCDSERLGDIFSRTSELGTGEVDVGSSIGASGKGTPTGRLDGDSSKGDEGGSGVNLASCAKG